MQISGVFNLPASANWAQAQTRTVRLEAQTVAGVVTVNLPIIADIQALNGEGVEIIVSDDENNATANPITIVANLGAGDTFEGAANVAIILDDGVLTCKIGADNIWTSY